MAKFFVKGTTTKVDAIKDTEAYKDSIIFDTDLHIIYHNGSEYGVSTELVSQINDMQSAIDAIKSFSTVSGNTGSASAPNVNSTLNIKGDGTIVKTTVNTDGVTIAVENMTAATASASGKSGLVPAPASGKQNSFLRGDGTWVIPTNTDTKVTSAANHYTPTTDTNSTLSADSGKYISEITRDSKGHITGINQTSLPSTPTLITGTTNGTVKYNGTDVSVKGLGSAAYTSSSNYATSTQGTKADNAVPNTRTVNSKQLNANIELTGADIKATGYALGTNAAIAATDTINAALGKAQAQINSIKTTAAGAMQFKGVVTTLPSTANAGDVYIKDGIEYVWDNTNNKFEEFGDQSLLGQLNTDVTALKAKPGLDKTGTVTSVAMTVPTGLSITGSPITTSGTLAINFISGYSIPTTAKQTEWNNKVSFPGWATELPLVNNSTAKVGTANKAAREDHVHPLQPSVAKLTTARSIALGNDLSGSASFDGSANITINASLEWEEL